MPPDLKEGAGSGTNAKGKLFSIPPTEPFLGGLADAILSGHLPGADGQKLDQFQLSRYEIYLPNRNACRALAQIFLRRSPYNATLLPRLRPLGSAEEDELLLLQADDDSLIFEHTNLPVAPAINAMERRLALSSLVLAWARQLRGGEIQGEPGLRIADTPAAASEMALDLMRLMDEAETEHVDLGRIAELIPDRFAAYEELSLNFLSIVINAWPAFLTERGVLNPADRRNRLMALETERLRRTHHDTPVILAGSTGSIPATAELMKAVISLPKGAIVLPGLDLMLDEAGWQVIDDHPEHPQAGLAALLKSFDADRGDVREIESGDKAAQTWYRRRLVSEAMRPAAALGSWPEFIANASTVEISDAVQPISLVETADEQEEAATIAIIVREVMETPGKTANLVTPDPLLARRVSAELARWGMQIESSEGEPLRVTETGSFYELIANAAAAGDPITLLTLLKHPYTRLGLEKEICEKRVRLLELAAIRQSWCGKGLDRLTRSLELAKSKKPRHRLIDQITDEEWDALGDLISRIGHALAPLSMLKAAGLQPLNRIAAAHLRAAQTFASNESGESRDLSGGAGGEEVSAFMSALSSNMVAHDMTLTDYPGLWQSLIRLERTRPKRSSDTRLKILSVMQARLTSADLTIIAGVNEGTWPQSADPGPWLNRTTRASLDLPAPEQKTRLSAHDFSQLLCAPEVIMTRALKSDGAPTVPSRWLMRLKTLLKGLGLMDALSPPRPWSEWASARNNAAQPQAATAPAPCPPLEARPRTLSVSNIETLIANPYAIYASTILGLAPINPLGAEAGGAERGQILHDVLHLFTRRFGNALPKDCVSEMLRIFDSIAGQYGDQAHVKAFWRPRLERFAGWFAETEAARRGDGQPISEVRGAYSFTAPGGLFRLTARADRIDLHPNGLLAIYDYKSGHIPSETAVTSFKAPQLPLEALIAIEGGFDAIESRRVVKLAYVSAKGGDPAGQENALSKTAPDALAEGAREGLTALIARFDDPHTPYTAMRRAAFAQGYLYDAYAHLARLAEWADAEEGEP